MRLPSRRKKMNKKEIEIVFDLFHTLSRSGWEMFKVYDGEESHHISSVFELIEAVESVELVWVYFRKNGRTHGVMLIQGNDQDIISDYTYNNEEDEFQNLVESVSGYGNRMMVL